MKPIRLIYMMLIYLLASCEPVKPEPPKPTIKPVYENYTFKKVVKGKSSEQKSSQDRKYSLYNDQFYNETTIYTNYYLAYSDGSTEQVDARKYAMYDKGDTVYINHQYVVRYDTIK